MLILQAYRFRLRESAAQAQSYARAAGCCRFAWNKALALQLRYYRRFGKHLAYTRLANRLPHWKKQHPFLAEAPSQALQQTLKDLDLAWARFFKDPGSTGRPRFKHRNSKASFRLPQGIELQSDNQRIRLAKLGWVRLRLSQPVHGLIKNVTVSRDTGSWFISIQTEREQAVLPRTGTVVGIDVGAVRSATASSGAVLDLERMLKKHQKKLRYLQHCLARKQKGSNRYQRARHKVARKHSKIVRIREDAIHKLSHALVHEHAVVVLEDLDIKGMTVSGARHKTQLNYRMLNAGWGALQRQCSYKSAWSGGLTVRVNPAYTSLTCSNCGNAKDNRRMSQAWFRCSACGHRANADDNAASTIRNKGINQALRAGTLVPAPGVTGAGGRFRVVPPSSDVEGGAVRPLLKRTPAEGAAALAA